MRKVLMILAQLVGQCIIYARSGVKTLTTKKKWERELRVIL